MSPGTVFVPCGDSMPTRSVRALFRLSVPERTPIAFGAGPFPPAVKRNQLATDILRSESQWVLFLDSDMVPPPDLVYRLLEAEREIVGALYTCRHNPDKPEAGFFRGDGPPERLDPGGAPGLVAVDWIGAGALLVRRAVFETVAAPLFQEEALPEGWEYTGGRNDDLGFCAKVGKAGFQVWCHTGVTVPHMALLPVSPPVARESQKTWEAPVRTSSP